MADYTQQTYVDDDGSATTGTAITKALMDNIEGGVKDAAQNSKQKGALSGRPAAAAGNKNWIWADADGALSYSDGSKWVPIGASRIVKKPVDVAMMTNINTAAPGGTLDAPNGVTSGVTRVLLMGQSTASQNGIWIFQGAATPMTRALDAAVIADDIPNGTIVPVALGSANTWETAEFYLQSGSGGSQVWGLYRSPAFLFSSVSLPTNIGAAADGVEIAYQADATNGVMWRLKYHAGSGSAYKWEFLGGSALWSEVTTAQGTATTASYVALTTTGPSVTLPLGGDYDVEIGARQSNSGANAGGLMSYDIGATGALDADAIIMLEGSSNQFTNNNRSRRKTSLAASTLTSKYKSLLGNTATFEHRWMKATPVRVG